VPATVPTPFVSVTVPALVVASSQFQFQFAVCVSSFPASENLGRSSTRSAWEQGSVSPPIESLLACLHACGFDLPFVLVPLDESVDAELTDSLMLAPSSESS